MIVLLNWCTGFRTVQKLVYWSKYFHLIQVIVAGLSDPKVLPLELAGTEFQSSLKLQNR